MRRGLTISRILPVGHAMRKKTRRHGKLLAGLDTREPLIWTPPRLQEDCVWIGFDCELIYGLLLSVGALAQMVIRAPVPHLHSGLFGQVPYQALPATV